MDENEFRRLLELFPVVRTRDYHVRQEKAVVYMGHSCVVDAGALFIALVDLDLSRQSSRSGPSEEAKEWQDAWSTEDKKDAFWGKLKSAAERKVGAADAERFCKAFEKVYKKLVYEELTLDAARRIMNSRTS